VNIHKGRPSRRHHGTPKRPDLATADQELDASAEIVLGANDKGVDYFISEVLAGS
jgi:hypothetical protein